MPHVERDSEAKPKQTLCEDDASLMQAWSEDGTALVRPWCEDSKQKSGLHRIKFHFFYLCLRLGICKYRYKRNLITIFKKTRTNHTDLTQK